MLGIRNITEYGYLFWKLRNSGLTLLYSSKNGTKDFQNSPLFEGRYVTVSGNFTKKKNFNVCPRWHILWSYCFAAEVTFKNSHCQAKFTGFYKKKKFNGRNLKPVLSVVNQLTCFYIVWVFTECCFQTDFNNQSQLDWQINPFLVANVN